MFNLSGSELVFLLLLALIVLGPEKLPDAVRRFGKVYGEAKKMSTGFQTELRSALDEPMREMRETADALKKVVNFDELTGAIPTPSAAAPAVSTIPATDPATEPAPEPAPDPVSDAPSEPVAFEPAAPPAEEAPPA